MEILTVPCSATGAKWFGGLDSGKTACLLRLPLKEMTALATIYTQFGFVMAADGRERWEHGPSRDFTIVNSERDNVQKIFQCSFGQAILAYAVRGHTSNQDRSFDFVADLCSEIANLNGNPSTCEELIAAIAARLERKIELAKSDGRIQEYPETFVTFVGYFRGLPKWIELYFAPVHDLYSGRLYSVTPVNLYHGHCVAYGSRIVTEMISLGHPAMANFCAPFNYDKSLRDAAGFVRGYIEACVSPLALRFDPDCESLGGHIHVATISQSEGFKWKDSPRL